MENTIDKIPCQNNKCEEWRGSEIGNCYVFGKPEHDCIHFMKEGHITIAYTTERKAMMWDALMSCERIRVLGSAKLGKPGYQVLGVEFYTQYRDKPDNSFAKRAIKTFVNAIMSDESNNTKS